MKSKISFFNWTILKKNLTRFWFLPTAYFLFLISYVATFIGSRQRALKYPEGYSVELQTNSDFIHPLVSTTVVGFLMIYIIIVTLAVFSYLFNRTASNAMHSFPTNRKQLYATGVLSVILMTFVPQLITMTTFFVSGNVMGAGKAAMGAWYILLVMVVYDVLFIGIACFAALSSGQVVTAFVFYWIYNFVFLMAELVLRVAQSAMGYGMLSGLEYSSLRFSMPLTPALYLPVHLTDILVGEQGTFDVTAGAAKYIIIYLIAGIAILVGCYFLYKKKHIETAGDFIAIPVLKAIFSFGTTFFIAIFVGTILDTAIAQNSDITNNPLRILGAVLCFGIAFIIYYVGRMLIAKSFRVFKAGNFRFGVTCAAATMVAFLLIAFDVAGAEDYIPDMDDVSEIHASIMSASYVLDDATEMEGIAAVHKDIIDQKDYLYHYQYSPEDKYYDIFTIYYHMKDGSVIRREYNVIARDEEQPESYEEMCTNYENFFNNPERIKKHLISTNYEDLTATTAYLYSDSYSTSIDVNGKVTMRDWDGIETDLGQLESPQDTLAALYTAILQDIDEGNFWVASLDADKPYCGNDMTIELTSPVSVLRDSYRFSSTSLINVESEYYIYNLFFYDGYSGSPEPYSSYITNLENYYVSFSFYFPPECSNLINALTESGLLQNEEDLLQTTNGEGRLLGGYEIYEYIE